MTPILMYEAEENNKEESQQIAERNVLRLILGPVKVNKNEFSIR